jgi:hypothetical protein
MMVSVPRRKIVSLTLLLDLFYASTLHLSFQSLTFEQHMEGGGF